MKDWSASNSLSTKRGLREPPAAFRKIKHIRCETSALLAEHSTYPALVTYILPGIN